QERKDSVTCGIKADRMCTGFRLHGRHVLAVSGVDDIDHTRVADGYVDVLQVHVEEDDIRHAAQVDRLHDFPRIDRHGQELSTVARTEEPASRHVEVETVRP